MSLEMAVDLVEMDVEPCLIHKAVFAWVRFDPKRYFTRKKGMTSEQIARRGGARRNVTLHNKIYELRNPPKGRPMTQQAVADLLGVSVSTVKTYQKRYGEGV